MNIELVLFRQIQQIEIVLINFLSHEQITNMYFDTFDLEILASKILQNGYLIALRTVISITYHFLITEGEQTRIFLG